ncbi:hypothetical protein T484DRAFT_1755837 [Baffinella frigidus]|nr:hypothetical protein T484DRAFT_1755837 [Cryptophyta sp. CCMP2293]
MPPHGMLALAIRRSHSADAPSSTPSPVAFRRMQSLGQESIEHNAPTAACEHHKLRPPPALVRAESSSSRTNLSRAAATILLERLLPPAPRRKKGETVDSSRPRQHPLATWRHEHKAKQIEKIVQARAALKQRLVDYCALKEHAGRDEHVAGA